MNIINHQYRLAARPVGLPKHSDWNYTQETLRDPGEGEVAVQVLYLSLDPAMRGWMNEGRSYIAPVGIGEVMRAGAVGRVIESRHPDLAVGDLVSGALGVQQYAVLPARDLTRIDTRVAPLTAFLGTLGVAGLTAYFGLLDIGKPQPGQTLVVSGAAGAVGMVVGQLAKHRGCRVVGIAGGPEKCRYVVEELGFDAAIDYKSEDVRKALRQHCPKGVDIYFDNVGGDILDDVLTCIRRGARIVICGAISQYNNTTPVKGPSNYLSLLVNRATMTGLVVFDYADRYGEAIRDMAGLMAQGELVSREDVVEGLETFPETLLKLFRGENTGKLVLKVSD